MKRPGWWPARWSWPGGDATRETVRLPEPRSPGQADAPEATFLAALAEAFGARRATLLRLDRERGAWVVERDVVGPDGDAAGASEMSAAGHPLTWCVREELIVQVPAGELSGDRADDGWALAGPAPGGSRVLVVRFHGAPPSRARRAMRPALEHLGALGDRPESRG